MNPLARLSRSSTAWFGALLAIGHQVATHNGWSVPWELIGCIVGAYGVKEAGAHMAGAREAEIDGETV